MRKHKSISICLWVATATIVALISAAQPARATSSAAAVSPNFYADRDANFAASQLAQRLDHDASSLSGYAGTEIVPAGVEVDFAGAIPATFAATEAANLQSFQGKPISVSTRLVSRSLNQLDALAQRISADTASWQTRGITITAWGVSTDSNTLTVMLAHYTAAAETALDDQYGAENLSVDHQDMKVSGSSDRGHDTSPWWGGDYIDVAGAACTSWFSITNTATGQDYNATAGHCGLGNVYNGVYTNYQGDVVAGRQVWHQGGSTDVEFYPVTANEARVWADPTTQSRLVTSKSLTDPVNTLLCVDGNTDREVCSVRIKAIDVTLTYNGKTIQHQVYCEQDNQVAAFSAGDSGGPVYAGKNGSAEAQAFGMDVAYNVSATWQGFYTPERNIFGVLPAGFDYKQPR